MTEPTDAEAWEMWLAQPLTGHAPKSVGSFARAVLAKWGTPPAPALVPCGFCELAGIPACKPDSEHEAERECGQNNPAIIATPQPTQAQAGAVPLTDEQLAEMMRETWGCASIAPRHAIGFARAIEAAHGIGIKGGQHG